MSRETFTVAYDGPALRDGAMDVRDLAPALLAFGQLMDAANANLHGPTSHIKLQVRATSPGSFQIRFDLVQDWHQTLQFFASTEVSGATNLLAWVLGIPSAGGGLFWLIRRLRGQQPDTAVKRADDTMTLTFDGETLTVPLEVMRLYQDLAVRTAAQKVVEEPLKKDGIDAFRVLRDGKPTADIPKGEAASFARPVLPDEILTDDVRRAAFSIVSLAFKDDNKWRLYDGNTQISARIEDRDFLDRVDSNQIAFAKGDILICDVRVTQTRAVEGLKTDYVVERVVEHRPAIRQLPLAFEG